MQNESDKWKDLLTDTIIKVRGQVINECILLEYYIDTFITEYFCTNNSTKGSELSTLILAPRVTWLNKFQVFETLLKMHNPEFLDVNKDLSKEITEVIEERNIFAHYPNAFDNNAVNDYKNHGIIVFFKFKNATEKETKKIGLLTIFTYSESDIRAIIEKVRRNRDIVKSLFK